MIQPAAGGWCLVDPPLCGAMAERVGDAAARRGVDVLFAEDNAARNSGFRASRGPSDAALSSSRS